MNETSLSLLDQLCQSSEPAAWDRLMDLYAPLLRRWMMQYDLQDSDAEDILQEVLLAVSKDVGNFEHNGRIGAFRTWLKTILIHRLRQFWRTGSRREQIRGDSDLQHQLKELEDPESELSQLWNQQHDRHVAEYLMRKIEPLFTSQTWQAFTRVALQDEPADRVAAELGLSLNAVFIAKSRVLKRLRQEAAGLTEVS